MGVDTLVDDFLLLNVAYRCIICFLLSGSMCIYCYNDEI